MQLPLTPKLEEGTSCSLPPIFPPTPTSANSDNQDFLHYFESRITQDYQDSQFLPPLHSPGFTVAAMAESSIYDNFFKHEAMYQHSSCNCMAPNTLSLALDGIHTQPHFEATPPPMVTPPPLTPQSSFCSSNSPFSHASIRSPESSAMTPDQDMARPLSQGSMYNIDSPQIGDVAHTPMLAYSTNSSTCTSPLCHTPVTSDLAIAASLDLVAGAETECAVDFMQHSSYMMQTSPPMPSLYPMNSNSAVSSPYPSTAYTPVTTPMLADTYSHTYPQYDFELHHLMSDPNELLTKTLNDVDTKPNISQLSVQAHTPPTII